MKAYPIRFILLCTSIQCPTLLSLPSGRVGLQRKVETNANASRFSYWYQNYQNEAVSYQLTELKEGVSGECWKCMSVIDGVQVQSTLYVQPGSHKEMSSILADHYHPRIWAQMQGDGGGGGVAGSQPMSPAVDMEPKINFTLLYHNLLVKQYSDTTIQRRHSFFDYFFKITQYIAVPLLPARTDSLEV
jgi:hypothetical protein